MACLAILALAGCGDDPVTPPATLVIDPSALTFDAIAEIAPAPSQLLRIRTDDGRRLEWHATTSASWLRLEPTSGTTSAAVAVHVAADGPAGVHEDSVIVTAGDARTVVPVTYAIDPAPPEDVQGFWLATTIDGDSLPRHLGRYFCCGKGEHYDHYLDRVHLYLSGRTFRMRVQARYVPVEGGDTLRRDPGGGSGYFFYLRPGLEFLQLAGGAAIDLGEGVAHHDRLVIQAAILRANPYHDHEPVEITFTPAPSW